MDDFFSKKILESIYKLYTDKNADDLLFCEEYINKSKSNNIPKKTNKNKKRKLSKSKAENKSNEMDNIILNSHIIKINKQNEDFLNSNSNSDIIIDSTPDFLEKKFSESILDLKKNVISSFEDDFEISPTKTEIEFNDNSTLEKDFNLLAIITPNKEVSENTEVKEGKTGLELSSNIQESITFLQKNNETKSTNDALEISIDKCSACGDTVINNDNESSSRKKSSKKKIKKQNFHVESTTLTIPKSDSQTISQNEKKNIPGTSWKGSSLKTHTSTFTKSNNEYKNLATSFEISNKDTYNNAYDDYNQEKRIYTNPPLFSYNSDYIPPKVREGKDPISKQDFSTSIYNPESVYHNSNYQAASSEYSNYYNNKSSNYNSGYNCSYGKKYEKYDNFQKLNNKNNRSNNFLTDSNSYFMDKEGKFNNNEGNYYLIRNTININNYNQVEKNYGSKSTYYNNKVHCRPYYNNPTNNYFNNSLKSNINYYNNERLGSLNDGNSKYANNYSHNINIMEKINKKIYPFTFYYRLHNDILQYSNSINERLLILKDIKLYIIKYLEDIIKNSLNFKISVDIHGSFATELQIESSDIDFTIHPISMSETFEEYNTNEIIHNICKTLINFEDFEEVNPILTATVPIIKLV